MIRIFFCIIFEKETIFVSCFAVDICFSLIIVKFSEALGLYYQF